MDKIKNNYSRKYELDFDKGVYNTIAENLQIKKNLLGN